MKEFQILESNHVYNSWQILDHTGTRCTSSLRTHKQRSILDDLHEKRVYEKAGHPFDIISITGKRYKHLPVHEAIPKSFSDEVCKSLQEENLVLIPHGYCAYAPAVIGGMQRAYGPQARIGVIWIDAYYDNVILEHTKEFPATFVSIPLSAICGCTMQDWCRDSCGMKTWIPGERILAADGRLSDEEAEQNKEIMQIHNVNAKQFEDSETWLNAIDQISMQTDFLYVMIDADILAEEYVAGYYESEPGGHSLRRVVHNLKDVLQTGKVKVLSCFCFDFDKYEQGGNVNSLSEIKIIETAFKNWK